MKQSNIETSTGGYWMIFGLVVMLSIPMVIGHFTLKQEAAPTLHADASAAN